MENTPSETQPAVASTEEVVAQPVAAPAAAPAVEVAAPSALDGKAKVSFILGLVAIVAWIIPLIGLPVTITGLVFGIKGLKAPTKHGKAVTGIVLASVFLLLTLINAAIGAYMGATGQLGM